MDRGLQRRIKANLPEIYGDSSWSKGSPPSRKKTRYSLNAFRFQTTNLEAMSGAERRAEMYSAVVGPLLDAFTPILPRILIDRSPGTSHADLFIWSLLQGNEHLALVLWKRAPMPIHLAALGAHVCQRMASRVYIGQHAGRSIRGPRSH